MNRHSPHPTVAIIGAGPAGLMAAEVLCQHEVQVDVYEAKPSAGRKFLIAGKGGLNLTHSEPLDAFLSRYGSRQPQIAPLLAEFGPDDVREWVKGLGFETFVGSSGRIFPTDMKAAPLLRAWLKRLQQDGVTFLYRHRWCGWVDNGSLRFETPDGEKLVTPDATILALGGGSWAKLGSDGAWVPLLEQRSIPISPLKPSNCGFDVAWSDHFRTRFAGRPLKSVILTFTNAQGLTFQRQGEFVVSEYGVEGSLIYAVSAMVRDAIDGGETAVIHLDLTPNKTEQHLRDKLSRPRGKRSISSHLQSHVGIKGVKTGLLREFVPKSDFTDSSKLAAAIKALPIPLIAPRPLDEAISTAGGVLFEALDEHLMVRQIPGLFCAGEMLDWEAPTGGYLLTGCFATGRIAAKGALRFLYSRK